MYLRNDAQNLFTYMTDITPMNTTPTNTIYTDISSAKTILDDGQTHNFTVSLNVKPVYRGKRTYCLGIPVVNLPQTDSFQLIMHIDGYSKTR